MRFKRLLATAALAGLAYVPSANAVSVLNIFACYACQNTGNAAIDAALTANPTVSFDGLLLAFVNTGASAITGATFSVTNAAVNDAFSIGTIAAGATVILLPGLSNDGNAHLPGGLFAHTGATMDTSDGDGSVTDASIFSFAGLFSSSAVTSGNIVPGDASLIRTWRDVGATGQTTFLGLGPNGDGGCTNCYFGLIGNGNVNVTAPVPEPETYALMLAGLGALGWASRRRKSTLSR